jgi:hypothetical protein
MIGVANCGVSSLAAGEDRPRLKQRVCAVPSGRCDEIMNDLIVGCREGAAVAAGKIGGEPLAGRIRALAVARVGARESRIN